MDESTSLKTKETSKDNLKSSIKIETEIKVAAVAAMVVKGIEKSSMETRRNQSQMCQQLISFSVTKECSLASEVNVDSLLRLKVERDKMATDQAQVDNLVGSIRAVLSHNI